MHLLEGVSATSSALLNAPPPLLSLQSAGAACLRVCCATTPNAWTCGACTLTKRLPLATSSASGERLCCQPLFAVWCCAVSGIAAVTCTPFSPPCQPDACTPLCICRALFERATHLQLPPKKMKFLFKR